MNAATITRILQSRAVAVFIACVCSVACWWAFHSNVVVDITGDRGLALTSPNHWIDSPTASMWTGIGLTLACALLMIVLNSTFNFIRSISAIYASVFILMQTASPDIAVQLYGGTVLAFTSLLCTIMLFSCYNGAGGNRRIFLIFFLLSLGGTCLYSFIYLIPVFFIGLLQMRILSLRTFVAALLGLLTPIWILCGFGIISIDSLRIPQFTSIFTSIDTGEALHLVFIVAVTAAIGIGSWALNFTKLIAYNARNRAFNGFIAILTVASLLMMLVDYSNILCYLPLFNICAAFQAGHFIAVRQRAYGYISICCLWAIYISFYLWRMLV